MPYALRWVLFLPRGPHATGRLLAVLAPRPGERLLEVGPGVGVQALPVARALEPSGVLEVLDVQQEMLDDLVRRARQAGVRNIVARRADARALPYPDESFDAAYLVGVLGEIPDGPAALRELRRVLKPGGRLVIGEAVIDPDYVAPGVLGRMAGDAGFAFERQAGPSLAYFARFRRPEGS
jgi:ubiquinone/menaquinone biosynthesis C-methylase UbiE